MTYRIRWSLWTVLLTLVLSSLSWSAAPTTARASETCGDLAFAFPWASQHELANWGGATAFQCRRNFVTDPGSGRLLDAGSADATRGLLSPDRVAFYVEQGFTTDFLFWGKRSTIRSGPDDTRQWTACNVGVDPGDICRDLKIGPMGRDWDAEVTLDVIGDDRAFIALVCGNYRVPVSPPLTEAPEVSGIKFRDDDRDGVRDAGEPGLAGWEIRLRQVTATAGTIGAVMQTATAPDGTYTFSLEGRSPGRYVVEEVPQQDWRNYTPLAQSVDIPVGSAGRNFEVDFGNAQTVADVAKQSMTVHGPDTFDVDTPTEVRVDVELVNRGGAHRVPVLDVLEVTTLPEDCVVDRPRQSVRRTLVGSASVSVQFSFEVTCSSPSQHLFEFTDTLTIEDPDIRDVDLLSNTAVVQWTPEVHAFTTLGAEVSVTCPDHTWVDTTVTCTADGVVTNSGHAPVDVTVALGLHGLLPDCTWEPDVVVIPVAGLVDDATVTADFDVTCSERSHHPVEAAIGVTADDPHVFAAATRPELEPARATAATGDGNGSWIIEVFEDATMAPTSVHLVCDETVGQVEFTCTATVDHDKTGTAPAVRSIVSSELLPAEGCTTIGPSVLEQRTIVDGPGTTEFSWTLRCDVSDVLRPAAVTADLRVDLDADPHAVDEPGGLGDVWEVPYCLPTVNPHGKKEPQAPGSGMNEDGFYVFGTLAPFDAVGQVSIRDTDSGTVFGPFGSGTRIKWVEANGAEPSISSMGGNNGSGKGKAMAVDHQIRANGDAQAFFVDERGVEVSVTCLVPNPPK